MKRIYTYLLLALAVTVLAVPIIQRVDAADNINSRFSTVDMEDVTASAAELNIMDGVTSTTAELNIMDGVTATAAEINTIDGIITGQYDDDPNAASDSVYVSGITATSYLIATVNDATNGAYLLSAEPFSGGFLFTLSADPADSVRISYIVLE